MSTIKTLQIFDFDETVVRAPGYTSKKQVETDDTKFNEPYEFYDHPLSLSESAHNIQLISPVYEAWKKGSENSTVYSVLITHRVKTLAEEVGDILNKRGVKFDRLFFLGRTTRKIDTAKELIDMFPDLETIEVYEDSIQQIFLYQTFFSRLNAERVWKEGKNELEIKIYIVDKSKTYRIKNIELSEEQRIKLI